MQVIHGLILGGRGCCCKFHTCLTEIICEGVSIHVLAGWFAAQAPGNGEWIFKHAACGTSILLSQGLLLPADLGSVSSSIHHTHTHTLYLSTHPSLNPKRGWFTAWRPCVPLSLLAMRDADQDNKAGGWCGASPGLSSLITFCTPPTVFTWQLWKQMREALWWQLPSTWTKPTNHLDH